MEAASRRAPPAAPLAESTGRLPRARGVAAAAAEDHVGEASPECAERASALPTAKSSANSGVAWPEWPELPGKEGGRCEAMRRGGSDDSRAVRMLPTASAGASGAAAVAVGHEAALSGSVLESLGASEPACGRCSVADCVCMHVVLPSCGAAVGMQVMQSGNMFNVCVWMIETGCNKRSQYMHTTFELGRKPCHMWSIVRMPI